AGYTSNIEKKEHPELNVLSCCSENKDADPKSVVYTFFMQEHCIKGESVSFLLFLMG
ncbi:hypothetical protein DBR06_SOUSAS5410032, partial [Sousa chinensis]